MSRIPTLYWEGWEYFEGKKLSYHKSGIVKEIANAEVVLTNIVKHEYNGDDYQEISLPEQLLDARCVEVF